MTRVFSPRCSWLYQCLPRLSSLSTLLTLIASIGAFAFFTQYNTLVRTATNQSFQFRLDRVSRQPDGTVKFDLSVEYGRRHAGILGWLAPKQVEVAAAWLPWDVWGWHDVTFRDSEGREHASCEWRFGIHPSSCNYLTLEDGQRWTGQLDIAFDSPSSEARRAAVTHVKVDGRILVRYPEHANTRRNLLGQAVRLRPTAAVSMASEWQPLRMPVVPEDCHATWLQ